MGMPHTNQALSYGRMQDAARENAVQGLRERIWDAGTNIIVDPPRGVPDFDVLSQSKHRPAADVSYGYEPRTMERPDYAKIRPLDGPYERPYEEVYRAAERMEHSNKFTDAPTTEVTRALTDMLASLEAQGLSGQ